MQHALYTAEDKEPSVDDDGNLDGTGHRLSVLGVLRAADELGVVLAEQDAEGAEDQDREYGDDEARPCLHHTDDWLHLYGVLCAASFDWCVDICRDNAGVEVLAMLQLSTATTIVYGAAIDDVVGDGGPSRDPLGCRLADNPNPTLVLRVRVRIYPEQLTPNCSRQFI